MKNGLTWPPVCPPPILNSVPLWSFFLLPLFLNWSNPLHCFSVCFPRFWRIQKVFMGNGCSQRSGPSFPDDICCRTLLWKSSWPAEVRRRSIVDRNVLKFFIFGCVKTDKSIFLCGLPQWRSCLTSQMQPRSRRWSTVFHELGWERILVCPRQGDTRLFKMLQGSQM